MLNKQNMVLNKRNIKRYILPIIILVVCILVGLNLYLGKRLEKYLKRELIERTSKATDGFYTLSFRDLSINLWNGELKMEGIELKPDSILFKQWMADDSLQGNYIHATIDVIDFKGINLIWKSNYKQLHFQEFEIDYPRINVYNSTLSDHVKKATKNTANQTLYNLIKPYINALSVKTLNLKNASFSYAISDDTAPTVYSLTDVNFNAFDFRLDSNSSKSGKLLYCDNFDFSTNQSQMLLSNKDFSLYTENILLSTKDSIISIKNIRLLPQEEVWESKKVKPSTSLHGEIKSVGVSGIKFTRENGLNFLTARSFEIDSSAIKIAHISNQLQKENQPARRDTLVKSLSVYEIISPILASVAINHIGIENTKVDYAYTYKDSVERYSLESFKFNAYDFLVDSVEEVKQGFWYSRNFGFEAKGIQGVMTARNHTVTIEQAAFNSTERSFYLKNICLNPISTRVSQDYISGRIDSICIEKLDYSKGVSAQKLRIESPSVEYTKKKNARPGKNKSDTKHAPEINDLLSPFLAYLSIQNIYLNKGKFVYNDSSQPNHRTYKLAHFNFFATNFLLDEKTSQHKRLFFQFDHVGFDFKNFTSYHAGGDYHLSIQNGLFSTQRKELKLEQVKFHLADPDLTKQANNTIDFTTSLIHLHGFGNSIFHLDDSINMENLTLKNSQIKWENKSDEAHIESDLAAIIFKNLRFDAHKKTVSFDQLKTNDIHVRSVQKNTTAASEVKGIELNKFKLDLQRNNGELSVNSFQITDPYVEISLPQRQAQKQKPIRLENDNLYRLLKNYIGKIGIESFDLINGNARIDYSKADAKMATQKLNAVSFAFDGLQMDNVKETFQLDDLQLKMVDLNIPLDNDFYNLHIGAIDLTKNQLKLANLAFASPYPKMEFSYKHPRHDDWFDAKVDAIVFTDIDIPFYLKNQLLKIKQVQIQDAVLLNLKNRQINVPLRLVPMIYEGLQTAPVKLDIEQIDVKNLDVTYEELATKGTSPGKLFFTEMNGTLYGFTNVETSPNQFIRLEANGKLMGNGYFTATWMLPVDTLNDRFLLDVELNNFDLTDLNPIVTPLAPARIRTGYLSRLTFAMDATSTGGDINMLFLYNNLKVDVLQNKAHNHSANKFYSGFANMVLRKSNPTHPNRKNAKYRDVNAYVVRDPYHSTFNYLWQIIRPAAAESVGVSKQKQNFAKKIMLFVGKYKRKKAAAENANQPETEK